MTVVCNFDGCPFKSANNFCTKLTMFVDENGMCRQWWRNGQRVQCSTNVQSPQEVSWLKNEENNNG